VRKLKREYSVNLGREMVEKARVNVDQLIDKLKKAVAASKRNHSTRI
jgi:ferritin-like protein